MISAQRGAKRFLWVGARRGLVVSLAALSLMGGVCARLAAAEGPAAKERTQSFDRDPGWDGVNNRSREERPIRQDFGWSKSGHAGGGGAGEAGGYIQPAAEAAYYGKKLPRLTLDQPLTASGVFSSPGPAHHLLLGFFNHDTLNEWRTPNTIALRISGRGEYFYAWLEYCSSKWRAGGDSPQGFQERDPGTGKSTQIPFLSGDRTYRWSLKYDPAGNGGTGVITAMIGDRMAVCNLEPGHRQDGAVFDRFGLMNLVKHRDDGGDFWIDDVSVNGQMERFEQQPKDWEGRDNHRKHMTVDIRPRFDFGYSSTRYAEGKAKGELGGMIFRGDGRYPDKTAWYGDRIGPLSLSQPLRASGRMAMRRGVTDSTVLLGFFNAKTSTAVSPAQDNGFPDDFLGVAIEGPSSEGFLVYPVYRSGGEYGQLSRAPKPNRIYPDGKSHQWSLEYLPEAAGGKGAITVRLGENAVTLEVAEGHRSPKTRFDRFGLVTTRIDGNGQHVYFDDLTYTAVP